MSYFKPNTIKYSFPYECSSPTLRKVITYTEEELWNEIDRIMLENVKNKETPGTSLYYNLLQCSDSNYFNDQETSLMIEEYMSMKKFNLPLATTIDHVEYERLVIFSAIDDEWQAILKREQDGKK